MSAARTGILVLLPTLVALCPLRAQEPPPLAAGQYVRITAPTQGWDAITAVDVRAASPSRTDLGATLGAGLGLIGGVAYGVHNAPHCRDSAFLHGLNCVGTRFEDAGYSLLTGFAGGAVGSIVGGAIGHLLGGDRWKRVPLHDLRATILPQAGGRLGLGASAPF